MKVDLEEIQEYARQIAVRFNPEKIILFGSHAQGNADEESDVDLLVLMEFEGMPQEQAFRIRRVLPRRFPLDLLVRRPRDVARRVGMGDFFLKEVLEKGWVLHESTVPKGEKLDAHRPENRCVPVPFLLR